jgi:hypothetical protein
VKVLRSGTYDDGTDVLTENWSGVTWLERPLDISLETWSMSSSEKKSWSRCIAMVISFTSSCAFKEGRISALVLAPPQPDV